MFLLYCLCYQHTKQAEIKLSLFLVLSFIPGFNEISRHFFVAFFFGRRARLLLNLEYSRESPPHIGLVIQVVDVHLGDAQLCLRSCLTKVFQNTDLVIFRLHLTKRVPGVW